MLGVQALMITYLHKSLCAVSLYDGQPNNETNDSHLRSIKQYNTFIMYLLNKMTESSRVGSGEVKRMVRASGTGIRVTENRARVSANAPIIP